MNIEKIQQKMLGIEHLSTKIKNKLITHKQLSKEWFMQRQNRITGSKLSRFLFMDSVMDMQRLYEETFEGRPKEEFDELAKRRCAFGRDHEIHAICAYLREFASTIYM